jgi:hypothetical protein
MSSDAERADKVIVDAMRVQRRAEALIKEYLGKNAELDAALRDAKADGLAEAAEYVYKCGTASHPSGYGDWCGGEVDPIKLLVGISEVLVRKAEEARTTSQPGS